jgi:hypothetical protein
VTKLDPRAMRSGTRWRWWRYFLAVVYLFLLGGGTAFWASVVGLGQPFVAIAYVIGALIGALIGFSEGAPIGRERPDEGDAAPPEVPSG